jgi:hypothetical protein
MKRAFQKFSRLAGISLSIAVVSLVFGIGINIAFAGWTVPPADPPGGDIAAPINISSADQFKEGGLQLGGNTGPGSFELDVQGTAQITSNLEMQGSMLPTTSGKSLGSNAYPWKTLWIDEGQTEGITFDVSSGIVGIQYLESEGKLRFYRDGVQMSVSDTGELKAYGDIIGEKGLTIDTDTLHVDSSNDEVGIGTTDPGAKLDVPSGNVILGGRLTVGSTNFGSSGTNVSVGTFADPIEGIGLWANSEDEHGVVGFTEGTGQYGVYGAALDGIGVYGWSVAGNYYGVYGKAGAGFQGTMSFR